MVRDSFSWHVAALVAGLCAPAIGPVRADTSDPENDDEALVRVWRDVAGMIGANQPWGDCRARLVEGIAQYGESEHIPRCHSLLKSIELADARERAASARQSEKPRRAEDLIAALPGTRVDYHAVLSPHRYDANENHFVWEYILQHSPIASYDPACLLYSRGREVIPLLIDSLYDDAATRSIRVIPNPTALPLVLRVSDVALGLIEGISHCRFDTRSGQSTLLSEWPDKHRLKLVVSVQTWWDATRQMPPPDAILWQVGRVQHLLQLQMLDALIGMGAKEHALRFLRENYRRGDSIESRLADRMLRAGSREPLDFIHRAVKEGKRIDRAMVELIGRHGEATDYRLLYNMISAACAAGERPMAGQIQTIVEALQYSDNKLCVPIFVAAIEGHVDSVDAVSIDQDFQIRLDAFLNTAAEQVQRLSGNNFGYEPEASPAQRLRVLADIAQWWEREGCGAYGFAQINPHAPSGIR